jgi:hypothetical protein
MKVFVHVDADPDHDTVLFSESLRQRSPRYFQWSGLVSTTSAFETFREKMKSLGLNFKGVFFLRADEQVRTLYGAFSDIFTRFFDNVHKSFGVGWHPHLLRWSAASGCWCQEFRDNEWIHKMLTDSYDDLRSQGFQVRHTKMGWCFHNNQSMKTLSDLGIEADFSALPGACSPGRLVGNVSLQDRYDWSKTGPRPYRPSELDYQSSGALRILEIPLTTYEVGGLREFLYTTKLALPSYLKLDFSYFPSFRRMVPVFFPDLIRMQNLRGFCDLLMQANRDYITLYLHPTDLLNSNAQSVFESFILEMISAAESQDAKTSFADASELFNLYASDN